MRTFPFVLIPVLVIQATLVQAGASAERRLEVRWRDMSIEVERFLDGLSESDRSWNRVTEIARDEARLRTILSITPVGTTVTLTLRSGRVNRGRFESVISDGVSLMVPIDEETREAIDLPAVGSAKEVRLRVLFAEIDSADVPLKNGWRSPQNEKPFRDGTKVEALLVGGSRVSGKVKALDASGLTLDLGKGARKTYPLQDVVGLRKAPVSRQRILITTAAVAGGLGLAYALLKDACFDSGCR